MHFNVARTVRLYAGFDRLIDELNARANRHIVEQPFDVVSTQTYTAVADAQADTKVSVGTVNRIETTDVERIQAHRVIRTSRENRWQRFTACLILFVHFFGWRPGWAILFTLHGSGPVYWRIFAQFTDTNRQHHHGFGAFRVVVKTHFGAVDHNAFTRRVRQNQLLRNNDFPASLRQIDINTWVGFQQVAQAHLILRSKSFQRKFAVLRNGNFEVIADQAAVSRRKGINHCKSGLAKSQGGDGYCEERANTFFHVFSGS